MSTKYILGGGYINKAEDGGQAFYEEMVKGIDKNPVKILDCIFARPEEEWEKVFAKDNALFSKYIKNFESELAGIENFTEQVKNSDVVFLRGGYTQKLFEMLSQDKSWLEYLDGKVVAGTSAGAEVLAKYYHVLTSSRTGDALGLVNIKFVPHWKSSHFDGEAQNLDWDKILQELKEYKEDLPIYNLNEGEFVVFEN